jgi:hypothetical protein
MIDYEWCMKASAMLAPPLMTIGSPSNTCWEGGEDYEGWNV